MSFFRKTQKIFFITLLIFSVFSANALPVLALSIPGIPSPSKLMSPSKIASEMERRYNLDLGAIRNQGEYLNVADNKKMAPETSLFFSPSDPKEGEKISAKAFPLYFSNHESALYYTWFLKHADCNVGISLSGDQRARCDRDGNGRVTVEDWKIEAASIMVQNGYDGSETSTASGDDNDGYKASFGGENKSNTPDYCYIHDTDSGINYELVKNASNAVYTCPPGTSPVCMVNDESITSGVDSPLPAGAYFDFTPSGTCSVSGLPTCSSALAECGVGSPRCVANPTTTTSCGTPLLGCSAKSESSARPSCEHLFPKGSSGTSGDGSFGAGEERFWGSNPKDSSTADNGNKDEANVIGLSQSNFTWNYEAGDQVGVAIEGTSMIPTKHDDSSYMIMWAFSKNNCPVSRTTQTGVYSKEIKGYAVTIPTAEFDLNDCIEKNLVDPTQGGQPTNLQVTVTATPDHPINDDTEDKSGDIIIAQASISNAGRNLSNMLFDWKIEMSNNIQFNSKVGTVSDVTNDLKSMQLLSNTKGNALDTLRLQMDIAKNASIGGRPLSAYLKDDIGYIRFTPRVTENFSSGVTRKGKSDVIVKFTSSGKKISAYKAKAQKNGDKMKVSLPGNGGLICNDDALDRSVCRIIKNEVIGLKIDKAGLQNFRWTINGEPLLCSKSAVSGDCLDGEQNEINFFPVTGNVGDAYTVNVTANDVKTGKVFTITRTFNIIEPTVVIEPANKDSVWPKLLGQYKDIIGQATTACPGGLCDDVSNFILQTTPGNDVKLKARFIPSFLGNNASQRWTIDGSTPQEGTKNTLDFRADKIAGDIYNINFTAQIAQSDDTRRALFDIWNVSPFDSVISNLGVSRQIELEDTSIAQSPNNQSKYLAAIALYIPASVLFTLRILLTALLVLFTTHFLLLFLQGRRVRAFVANER
ncbi:MAG: hypothetical protein ACSLEX_00310 [Minisyncoccota bacterium]